MTPVTNDSITCASQPAIPQLAALAHAHAIPGIQIAYSKQLQKQYFNWGQADIPGNKPVSGHTIFQGASLSKPLVAYALWKLHDRGAFHLDIPLYQYVSYPRLFLQEAANTITARMVLTHTSGMPNWTENPLTHPDNKQPIVLHQTPGSGWHYSGEAFIYLQAALEQHLQLPLTHILQQEVFLPLGMQNSHMVWQDAHEAISATGYTNDGAVHHRFRQPAAAYSLYTHASDYLLFAEALMQHLHLSAPLHQQALSPQILLPQSTTLGWALGTGTQQDEKGNAIWHWGSNPGFRCFFMAYPQQQECLVCFTNHDNGLALMQPLLELFFGAHLYPAAPPG